MWSYAQKSGALYNPDGNIVAFGYAGKGLGKNNSAMQNIEGVGPLPCGIYAIGKPIDDAVVGKFALPLIPDPENEMFGRSAFFMHGENPAHPGQSSDGCIVQIFAIREKISLSPDQKLQVIPGLP